MALAVEDKGWIVWDMTKVTRCGLSAVWVVWVFFRGEGGCEYTRFGLLWEVFWLGEGKRMPYLVCVRSGGFTADEVERWLDFLVI